MKHLLQYGGGVVLALLLDKQLLLHFVVFDQFVRSYVVMKFLVLNVFADLFFRLHQQAFVDLQPSSLTPISLPRRVCSQCPCQLIVQFWCSGTKAGASSRAG